MPDISSFLQAVKLPVMPEVAHALIRTFDDPDADVQSVTSIVSKDPALTASLLRMANSAIFGLSRSVQTLDAAVSVVGMSQIRARALAVCMSQVFVFPKDINRLDFWRSCMRCAGYARWLADIKDLDEHQAWLTGLMLRLGELMIAQVLPHTLAAIEMHPCAPGERWQRERQHAGYDEGEISAAIAQHWDFPERFAQVLRRCARPLGGPTDLEAVVLHLASLLADHAQPGAWALKDWPNDCVAALGLDVEALARSMPEASRLGDISALHAA